MPPKTVEQQRFLQIETRIHLHACIHACNEIKTLGFTWDSKLTFKKHVNEISMKMHAAVRSLYSLRPFISQAALHMVVTAQCLSIINYMCMIWGGASTKVLRTVEKSIRACARSILLTAKYGPVHTQITDTLHWLMPKYLYQHATLFFWA